MRKLDSCGLHLGLSFALKTLFFFLHEFFFLVLCARVCVCHISEADLGHAEGGHDRDGAVTADNRSGRVNDRALPDPSHHQDSVCVGQLSAALSRAPQPASALCRWRWFYLRRAETFHYCYLGHIH